MTGEIVEMVLCGVGGHLTRRPLDYVEAELGQPDKRYPKTYGEEKVMWIVGSSVPVIVDLT